MKENRVLRKKDRRGLLSRRLNTAQFFITCFVIVAIFFFLLSVGIVYKLYSPVIAFGEYPTKEALAWLPSHIIAAYSDIFIHPEVTVAPFPSASTSTPTIYMTPTMEPTLRPDQYTTYISSKLGISFSYINQVAGRQNFYTREIGDTIYLYYNPSNKEFLGTDEEFLDKIAEKNGYLLRTFYKDPNQSLANAITQLVFKDKTSESCLIVDNTRFTNPRIDESFESMTIKANIPKNKNLSYEEVRSYIQNCTKYANGYRGISYFMMDPKHSNKFLFVQLGQDNIPSGVGGTWDGTIKVF